MGREYTGPCAKCHAGIPHCSIFRCFTFCIYLKYNGYIHFKFPSDIGSNIGSYSVAVAGMNPTREVNLPQFTFLSKFISLLSFVACILLLFLASIHCLVALQVIAVDADAVNLAYIRRSLEKNFLWGNGGVRLIHNAVRYFFNLNFLLKSRNCSDKRGILYLFNNSPYSNPGATKMLGKEDLMKMERPRSKEDREEKKTRLSAQDGVNAVLLQVDNPTRLIFCADRRVSQNNYKC